MLSDRMIIMSSKIKGIILYFFHIDHYHQIILNESKGLENSKIIIILYILLKILL